ncbi:hypothetical protein Tco_1252863 [Tanacetum coccineum]
MLYPRFTKVIIDYFMSKDQSISRRNKMFWHTARDDTMFTSMRCVSRHQKTQVYGAILPQHLTNQGMLESIAYQTYYAYATKEKSPKENYVRKKADSDTYPKKKTAPTTKGPRLKSSAKVFKSDKKKQHATKGLAVLSEVALTEAEQMKLVTKRSKIQFHSSHASGSDDGVDTQSKVPDEQNQKVSGINEGAGVGPEVLDVPEYKLESEEEPWTFSQGDDDDDDEHNFEVDKDDDDDDKNDSEETESNNDEDDCVHTKLSTYEAKDKDEEEKADDDEVSSDQKEEEDKEELYRDLNLNLHRSDAEMTDAQANQDTDDVHVTLTTEPLVSDNLVNVPVFVTTVTPSSETITPQPPIPITQPLQQTPYSTTTTTIPTTTLPEIPNFASIFRFDQRVSALETKMSEFKQTNQFAKVISSILGIVDNYLASKMKEAVDVAIQLQSNKLREEAQAENQ